MGSFNILKIKQLIFPVAQNKIFEFDASSSKEQEDLAAARARATAENFTTTAINGAICAFFVVVLLWEKVSRFYLISWFLLIVCWSGYTIKWYVWRVQGNASAHELVNLLTMFKWGGLVAGLTWGLGLAFFMLLVDFPFQAFLFALMVTVAAGTVYGIAPFYQSAAFFLCGLLLPTTGIVLVHKDFFHIFFTILIILLLSVCIRFAKANDVSFSTQVLLSLRNANIAQQLAQANTALHAANRTKTRFLAAANHDLRQPIHALSLLTMALRNDLDENRFNEARDIARRIQTSIDSLNGLFDTVLDISKLDTDMVKSEISVFPLWHIFQDLELHYGPLASQKGITFNILRTRFLVRSDRSLLDRIIRNFVSNAIRYTEHGRVTVGMRLRGAEIEIQVIDTGIGIPRAQHEAIFQEFTQLVNPTHNRSLGLGLGLSIVQRLAALLQHEIGVRSAPFKGSVFFVRVPYCGSSAPPAIISPHGFKLPENVLKNLFVVVIDDEEDILYGMEMLLKKHGCHVICAATARDALESLKKHDRQPDLIITDYLLSEEDNGIDVIHRVRASQELEIPALIVTGSWKIAEAAATTNCLLLRKPANEHQLLEAMVDILSTCPAKR